MRDRSYGFDGNSPAFGHGPLYDSGLDIDNSFCINESVAQCLYVTILRRACMLLAAMVLPLNMHDV